MGDDVRVGLGMIVDVRVGATVCVGLGKGKAVLVGKVVSVELGVGEGLELGKLAQPARNMMLASTHTRSKKCILLCIRDLLIFLPHLPLCNKYRPIDRRRCVPRLYRQSRGRS
jgi:hypothetical protein